MFFLKKKHSLKVPIYIFCHHKVATVLLSDVFSDFCHRVGLNFYSLFGYQKEIPERADVILFCHSLLSPDILKNPFVGVHIIRDPRDIVISGYLYHRRTDEAWCINKNFDYTKPIKFPYVPYSQEHKDESWKENYLRSLKGVSYQENLLSLNQDDGIVFEMDHYGGWTIRDILKWNYNHPNILEIRFEDLMMYYDDIFSRIVSHFNIDKGIAKELVRVSVKYDLKRKSDDEIRKIKHVSSTEKQKWKKYFNQSIGNMFIHKFDNALIYLGYEKNNDWINDISKMGLNEF